jgi:hypothetical protein
MQFGVGGGAMATAPTLSYTTDTMNRWLHDMCSTVLFYFSLVTFCVSRNITLAPFYRFHINDILIFTVVKSFLEKTSSI